MVQQNPITIKVKVNNNDDTRLWRYSDRNDFAGLCTFIQTTWNNDDWIVQYEDDEGDMITIASAQDLTDAFDLAVAENKKSLKLFVQTYVKQKRAQKQAATQQQPAPVEPEEKEEAKQFGSVREMIVDFLSDAKITALLPELFGSFVTRLTEQLKAKGAGSTLELEEITALLASELDNKSFGPITQHPLYQHFAKLAVPFVARKVHAQQQLYPHFRIGTIKSWIQQLLGMLTQVLQQTQGKGCCFKDVVIDIEYPAQTDTGKVIHFGVECDLCGMYPIIGDRYKCSICEDWDCCAACEPQHDHPLIKFKKSSKKSSGNAFKGLAEMMQKLSVGAEVPETEAVVEVQEEKQDVLDEAEPEQEAETEAVAVSEVECDCICGAKLLRVAAKQAYVSGAQVFCDECGCGLRANDAVYHCAKGKDLVHHPSGFDLCTRCAVKKATADQAKDAAAPVQPVAEVVEPPQEESVDDFEYAGQLAQIKQIMAMEGGDMDEAIKKMLIEHKGDLARVVPLLLR